MDVENLHEHSTAAFKLIQKQTTTQTLMAALKLSYLITYNSLTSLVVFSCRRRTPVRRSHNYLPGPVLPSHENDLKSVLREIGAQTGCPLVGNTGV